jgi:hypothetical protein
MSARLMRPGLRHDWNWSGKEEMFFRSIDETGGWPVGYQFVGFVHSDDREAGFCNSPHNDGWWTVIASSDDYYLWKLSPAFLQSIVDSAILAASLPRVDVQKVHIKNSRGYRATIAAPQKP